MNIRQKWFSLKLRNKFLIPTILAVFFGMGTSTLVTYYQSERSILNVQKENLELLSQTLTAQVNNFLVEIKANSLHWSNEAVFKTAVLNKISTAPDRESARLKLISLQSDYTYVENFSLIDTNGMAVVSDNTLIPGNLDISDKSYFKTALTGTSVISNVFESGVSGNPVFVIANPLFNIDYKVIGVFTSTIKMKYFNETIVEPINPGKSGYAFVSENNGVVIAHKDRYSILDLDINNYDYGKKILALNEGFISFSDEQGDKFISFRRVAATGWRIAVVATKNDILEPLQNHAVVSISLALLVCLIVAGIVFLTALSITRPISRVVKFADSIAQGEIGDNLESDYTDEIGQLIDSVNLILVNLKQIINQAENIAQGNFDVDIPSLSAKDVLTPALRKMTTNLRDVSEIVHDVANGDLEGKLIVKGQRDVLASSINIMVESLKSSEFINEQQREMDDFSSNLRKQLTGDFSLTVYGRKVIEYLTTELEMQIASYYFANDDGLTAIASVAIDNPEKTLKNYKLGEGLLGEVAKQKKIISIDDIPNDYINISSSLGQIKPQHLLLVPVWHNEKLISIFELASFKKISDRRLKLLESVLETIGINASVCESRDKTTSLLAETQEQANTLQNQQEKLQNANEELEEHTQQLKTSEEELKASNEELSEKSKVLNIQKNDLERSRKELELKSKDLELASKYKSEFLANMSHELRTPLNSFLLLSKSLSENKKGNLDADQLEDLNIIYEGGTDLLLLINDIMDLSKVEAGKLEVYFDGVELITTCNNIENVFNPSAKAKGIKFEVICEANVPETIISDSQRLEQILKNFLSNAFKFTTKGSIQLKIHNPDISTKFIFSHMDLNSSVGFSVTDTGIGIPVEKQKAIFDAFKQEDGSTSRQFGGTGLGLTISKELSKLLGGEIQLSSIQGEGSCFTLFLPLDGTSVNSMSKNIISVDTNLVSTASRKLISSIGLVSNCNEQFVSDDRYQIKSDDNIILIIEDDKDFAKMLLKIVRNQSYKGLVAGDGKNGLYLALEYKPKGIFLDLGLPDMDGKQVLDQLKYHLQTKHIPVHILSGWDLDIETLQKGAMGFLTKPADEQEINHIITNMERITSENIKFTLIVDSNLESQNEISAIIKNKGIKIDCVSMGLDAIEKLKMNQYDCVILDLNLLDISGFEVLKILSEDRKSITPPIIVYTGQELTKKQRKKLQKYATSIVLKNAESPEKLLDDAMLFMHSMTDKLSASQKKTIYSMHDENNLLKNRKVLLVDDDIRNTFALSKRLQESGINVYEADNGQSALNKLDKKSGIELVIMDIMMPVMDGYEAMRRIRKSTNYSSVPIIAITAKAMVEDQAKCINAGATDYLTKPVEFEKILSMLKVWLFKK